MLGRGDECALRVDDAVVSRKHAVLRRAEDVYVVEALLSANGTFVNDQRVNGTQPLAHDDVIRCGQVLIRLTLEEPAPGPEPAPAAPDATAAIVHARALGSENETLRRRVEDLETQLADAEELRVEERHVAEDLRLEIARMKADADKAGEALYTTRERLAGRETRLAQAEAEILKLRAQADRLLRGAAELDRLKDAGWAQANAAMHDAEQLREVIRQQARMLEERRVEILVLLARTERHAA